MQSSVRECSYRTLLRPTDLSLSWSCLYRALRLLTSQHQWPQLSPRSPAGPLLASFFWRNVRRPGRVLSVTNVVHQGLVLYLHSVERFHLSASEFPNLRPSAHQSTESSAFHVNRETCATAEENTQNNGPQKISFFQSKNILVDKISFYKQLISWRQNP